MSSISRNIALSGIGLGLLVWFISLAYGFQYLVSGQQHVLYFRVATIPFTIVVLFLTWQAVTRVDSERLEFNAPWWLGLAMMSISFGLACFFFSSQLAPLPGLLVATALTIAAYASHRRWGYRGANAAFQIGATLLFIYLMTRVRYDAQGDMLQIIDLAARDLLAGETPYRPYLTSSGREVPFGYWPGIFMPYVPLVALGLDMRILNLVCLGLMVLLFSQVAKNSEKASEVLSVTFYPFILSSPVWQMVLNGHLWLYWLLACSSLMLVARGRLMWAAMAFGLCLASRPTALFLAGPIVAYVSTRHGAVWALKSAAVVILVILLANMPLLLIYGTGFWNNSYGSLVGITQELAHFSLSGYLQGTGTLWVGKPIQIGVILATMAFIVSKRQMSSSNFIFVIGITFVWLILFNSYATRYVYFLGFFLIAMGLTMAPSRERQSLSPNCPKAKTE